MRKQFIQSHFSMVDLFVAPSRFLLDRYVDWGIPRERISYEEYGRQPVLQSDQKQVPRHRARIGFFGQLNFFKGIKILLEAMRMLAEENSGQPSGSLVDRTVASAPHAESGEQILRAYVYGANLDLQERSFQEELESLLAATRQSVTFAGPYDHQMLPRLMGSIDWVVVPSIWWENSPLVIQEAFQHGRPVICSDIGGMAEKVRHGIDGLHFRANDPADLARTLRYAVSTPGLWEKLRAGIPKVYGIQDHVLKLSEIYRDLLCRRRADIAGSAVSIA